MALVIKKSLSLYLVATLIILTAFAGYMYLPQKAGASWFNSGSATVIFLNTNTMTHNTSSPYTVSKTVNVVGVGVVC